jgi:glycosyltransferase involved in cell wall biosynthesis
MDDRIFVLQVINSFGIEGPGGGAGRFGIELARALNPSRFRVTVCAMWDFGMPFEKQRMCALQAEGIETFVAAPWDKAKPYQSFWETFRSMREHLAGEHPQLIHSHSEFGDVAVLLLKRMGPSPSILVRTVHSPYQYEWKGSPLRRLVFTNLLFPLFFDVEVGVAPRTAETLNRRRLTRWTKKSSLYIPNAVNLERFTIRPSNTAKMRESLGIPNNSYVVGTLGRLVEQKGQRFLIEAAGAVLEQLPNVYFLIVGDGDLVDCLKQLAINLNVETRILFLGARSDIESLLGCMDLFVSSSLWEGLPTVIMESMATGVPVVATDIPGNNVLIKNVTNGWLVPPADSAGLARVIIEALQNPGTRSQFAERAREDVKLYSLKNVVAEYEKVYSVGLDRLGRGG